MLGPVAYQEQLLKRQLWAKQRELLNAVHRNRTVSVKGCHASGKTYAVAGLVPYELTMYDESIVLVIAPTLRQVKNFWNEITDAISHVPYRVPAPTATRWEFGPKAYALGFSSSKGVNAQGFHGKRVLILADEAIGISGDLWDAIEGVRSAGDVRVVKLCNPTVPSGPVYEDFTRNRGVPGHACVTISAFDTPNLAGLTLDQLIALPEDQLDIAPYGWLTRRRWVREMYHKWGPANPRFQSRVLGEFPTQSDDAVFNLAWIERAGLPYDENLLRPHLLPGHYIQVGFDVAGPGDDETVAVARLGPYVLACEAWPDADPRAKALVWLGKLKARFADKPVQIVVVGDTVGIGYYFMKHIADAGFDVRSFIANAAPLDPTHYWNAKAEAHFTLREWMQANQIFGIEDEDTKAQLSDIRYRERAGKIEIEHKDEIRARGGRSPDRAEALVIAFCRIVPRQVTAVWGGADSYQISAV